MEVEILLTHSKKWVTVEAEPNDTFKTLADKLHDKL